MRFWDAFMKKHISAFLGCFYEKAPFMKKHISAFLLCFYEKAPFMKKHIIYALTLI